jgi:hypothetical protein
VDRDFEASLPTLDAGEFASMRSLARPFSLVILKKGPAYGSPNPKDLADPVTSVIYAHGMRNGRLFKAGIMPVICPVSGDPKMAGVGVIDRAPQEASQIMEADPAIKAGILVYEIYPTATFTIPERPSAESVA